MHGRTWTGGVEMRAVKKVGPPPGPVTGGMAQLSWIQLEKFLTKDDAVGEMSIRAVRNHFDQLDKPKVAAYLLEEQWGRCVYCEQRVESVVNRGVDGKEKESSFRIAHWVPISIEKRHALKWTNVYVSCSTNDTCDKRQCDQSLGLPSPAEIGYEHCIDYTTRGELIVSNGANGFLSDVQVLALRKAIGDPRKAKGGRGDPGSVLNLNDPRLCAARESALDGLRARISQQFPGRLATADDRVAIARELLAERRNTPFVSIQIAWLERRLKQ